MNKFKESLVTKPLPRLVDNNMLILETLGLNNLPDNIEAFISDDKKYIHIRLKNQTTNKNGLIFSLPLKPNNLDAYNNHPSHKELSDRYDIYAKEYLDKILDHSSKERKYLQEKFPGLVFNMKVRMKSKPSYEEKMNRNILAEKNVQIDDIIAERIIISQYNGSRDEKVLTDICYQVAQALYEFRGKYTDFRMKKTQLSNKSISDDTYLTKDYIKTPKDNGYQSLHITTEDKNNPDCSMETQIRTYDMEEISKKDEKISHQTYKPRLLNDKSTLCIPEYYEITNFFDSNGNPIVMKLPIKDQFYHYYSIISRNISLEKYRKELSEIQKYVSFSKLREKIQLLRQS